MKLLLRIAAGIGAAGLAATVHQALTRLGELDQILDEAAD